MNTQTKMIHEGNYMAEIQVEFTYTDYDWSPYLSLAEAQKLDNLRLALRHNDFKTASSLALRHNDFKTASSLARIYQLTPIMVP